MSQTLVNKAYKSKPCLHVHTSWRATAIHDFLKTSSYATCSVMHRGDKPSPWNLKDHVDHNKRTRARCSHYKPISKERHLESSVGDYCWQGSTAILYRPALEGLPLQLVQNTQPVHKSYISQPEDALLQIRHDELQTHPIPSSTGRPP